MLTTMDQPVYNHFNQVKSVIQGVEAIDYFFAKEMLAALTPPPKNQTLAESDTEGAALKVIEQTNLFHLFLALSASLRAGHSCLPLSEIAEQHWGKGFVSSSTVNKTNLPASDDIAQELSHAGFVFVSLTQLQQILSKLAIQASDHKLLVMQDDNLYLRRYFTFESDLGQGINARLQQGSQYNNDNIAQCIAALFPGEQIKGENNDPAQRAEVLAIDWQKVAVANAINKNFSVIAGGPGTGKTYTVTKLLAALIMLEQLALEQLALEQLALEQITIEPAGLEQQNQQSPVVLNIALVAPTGKAAQRLSESIVNAILGFKDLIADKVLAEIPTQAQTLHRLLGVIPNSPNFRHDQDNVLPYDIVLIDEVSMVDLPLMTRVFRALKPTAKVILLGDADQLPSVAAGSVLADIAPRPHGGFSFENDQYLTQVCQLKSAQLSDYFATHKNNYKDDKANFDYLSFLVKSRRFDGEGGIGLIANSVIKGEVKRSWQLLNPLPNQALSDDNQLTLAQGELAHWLAPLVKQYYKPIEHCANVTDAFSLLSQFRVLCATRQGDYGVERINAVIKGYLGKNETAFHQDQQILYHGQPIMINENDYRLGLYNGDIGIIWRVVDKIGKSHLMACFEDTALPSHSIDTTDEAIRQLLPSRLPKFESVYAMTIHKTQGSEFAHVAMALSATASESQQGEQKGGSKLLSRELLYTGITRAKKHLTIAVNQRVWQQGVTGQVKRHSGLNLYSLTRSK